MTVCWTMTGWAGGEDTVTWIPSGLGEVPARCLCGYAFEEHPAEPERLRCQGPWRHEWRSTEAELQERLERREKSYAQEVQECYVNGGRPFPR